MTEHQGLPVQGYRPQSDEAVSKVNGFKQQEERLLRELDMMRNNADYDQRWLAVARTHFEEGFMALNRSVFRPMRVGLPEDPKDIVKE